MSSSHEPAPAVDVLADLRKLGPNWNSYGALPPTERALKIAETMTTNAPWICPTNDGGVQIEWHCNGFDIEIRTQPDQASAPEIFVGEADRAPSTVSTTTPPAAT